jgi:hypothetical protein
VVRVTLSALIGFVVSFFVLACGLALYWFVGWNVSAEPGRFGGTAHTKLEGATLLAFEVVFYAILVLFLGGLVLASLGVAKRLNAHAWAAAALALFLAGLVAYPALAIASVSNDCALGTSFPLSVPGCD